ncbi:MAG: hypothetical protein ACRC45_01795, partial [Cetobacterium sp.]
EHIEKSVESLSSPKNKEVFSLVNERKNEIKTKSDSSKLALKNVENYKKDMKVAIQDTVKEINKAKSIDDVKKLLDDNSKIKTIEEVNSKYKQVLTSDEQKPVSVLPDERVSEKFTLTDPEYTEKWGVDSSFATLKELVGDPRFPRIVEDFQKYVKGINVEFLKRNGFSDYNLEKFKQGNGIFEGNHTDLFDRLGYSSTYASSGGLNTTYADIKRIPDLEKLKKEHSEIVKKIEAESIKSPFEKSIDLETSRLIAEVVNMSNIKEAKNLSTNEALGKVAQALKTVINQSKTVNEKALYKRSNDIKTVKDQYKKVVTLIKDNSKKDMISVYDKEIVKDNINKLLEMSRASNISDIVDDIIPQTLMSFHGKILDSIRESMDSGSILEKGKKPVKYNKNRLTGDNVMLARLSSVSNKQNMLNDKSWFVQNDADGKQHYPISTVWKSIKEGEKSLTDYSDVDISEYLPAGRKTSIENLYDLSNHLFKEVIGSDGVVRDMTFSEFAISYYGFLEDLGNTRSSVSAWQPENKKTLSSLVPFFKDQDAMVDFFLIDDPSRNRSRRLKDNSEMLAHAKSISEKEAEYMALGMPLETLVSLMKNRTNNPIFASAVENLDVGLGESKVGTEEYVDTFVGLLEKAVAHRNPSEAPKVLGLMLEQLTGSVLFATGGQEYTNTSLWNSFSESVLRGKGLDTPKLIGAFLKNSPQVALNALLSTPRFAFNALRSVPIILDIIRGNVQLNKDLNKYPHLKARRKYMEECIKEKIASSSASKNITNAEKMLKIKSSKSAQEKAGNWFNMLSEINMHIGLYMQHSPDFKKSMESHETAYRVMEDVLKADGFKGLKSDTVKGILRNMGISEELFDEIQDFLGRYVGEDGEIDLPFYNTEKMKKTVDPKDARIAQIVNNFYSTVFDRQDILNKDKTFEKEARTTMDVIYGFLKSTVSGIGKQTVHNLLYKTTDKGEVVSRLGSALRDKNYADFGKESLRLGIYTTTFVGLTGFGLTVTNVIRKLPLEFSNVNRNISKLRARLANNNDDTIDETSSFEMLKNGLEYIMVEGLKNMPFMGAYTSGGNILGDTADKFTRYLYSTDDPEVKGFVASMGIAAKSFGADSEFVDGATKKIVSNALFRTVVSMSGAMRFADQLADSANSINPSVFDREIKNQKDLDYLDREYKDSSNRKNVAANTYVKGEHLAKLFYKNLGFAMSNVGSLMNKIAEYFKN